MNNRELICISCPLGCNLCVEYDEKKVISVAGNQCKRGIAYAEKEIFSPERVVTTTMRVAGGSIPLISVKTERGVPKECTFDIVRAASQITVKAPIAIGDIIIEDVCGTGVNLIATKRA